MTIELLADNSDCLPMIVDWYEREWGPYYGVGGPGDAETDLTSRCNSDTMPIAFVAKENGQVAGIAALDVDVTTNLTPSVVGLFVAGEFRGRGVGSKLLRAATRMAEKLGYVHVYISTAVLGKHLLRNGWRQVGGVRFLNSEHGSVYVFDL